MFLMRPQAGRLVPESRKNFKTSDETCSSFARQETIEVVDRYHMAYGICIPSLGREWTTWGPGIFKKNVTPTKAGVASSYRAMDRTELGYERDTRT